eukprot:TRINITY_DN422_c0_g2_i1.p1 TRINITY_DN422_c0_g2~~TRINITY_DN422_c0_g2_i1.p1  ORF type:complete len:318 (-),score=165.03 TRINITY_DN422_c0_g2_i1:31-984(-)
MSTNAEIPANAPEHCPGVNSDQAGKGSACAGCPNQSICSTLPKGPDPDLDLINERMNKIKHKILVLSGKGGVGKSTVSAQLAFALSNKQNQVGILDVDICGPSIPKMFGTEGEEIHQSSEGWSPVYVDENLCLMSVAYLLSDPTDAVIWRGPKKNGLIKQFFRDVNWGDLDFLIVDTPPGTSDEHLSLSQYLKGTIDGAIIVTTPQEVALLDVRKEINFCRKANIPIIGVVENMSGFICPKCKIETKIFPPTSGGAIKMTEEMKVTLLGSISIDPLLTRACDEGRNFIQEFANSPTTIQINNIVERILSIIELNKTV